MIKDRIIQLEQEFGKYQSWEDRYRHIIKIGKTLETFPEQFQQEKYRVRGCQSQVWLKAELKQGKVYFHAGSDSVLVKGIIGLLVNIYNGSTPVEILQNSPDFLKDLGITEHLSMNRTNGLASMVKQIQMYANVFHSLGQKGVNDASP